MKDFLTNFYQDFKQSKWAKIILVLAIIAVVITTLINILMPPQKPKISDPSITDQNIVETTTFFQNISYSGEPISIEEELPLLEVKTQIITENKIEADLIEAFNLTPYKDRNNVWVGPNYSMDKASVKDSTTYSLTVLKNQKPKKRLRPTEAINKAERLVDALFPDHKMSVFTQAILYFEGFNHLKPANKNNAQYADIPVLNMVYDKYPIYQSLETTYPVLIKINDQHDLNRLEITLPIKTYEEFATSETISLEQAVVNINNNVNSTIVSAYQEQHGALNLEQIVSGDLKSVMIEFREDPFKNVVYPFYKFSGLLVNDEGTELQASILTPAITNIINLAEQEKE